MGVLTDRLGDVDFSNFIMGMKEGGWFDFVFPFMLVYAVVLTILNKVDIFEDKKAVRVIIALVFALFSISFPITGDFNNCSITPSYGGYSSNGCETLGNLMMSLFPGVTAFSMGVLALYIVVAMLGVDLTEFFGKDEDNNNILKYILGALGLFVVIYYYAIGFGWEGFDGDNWLWGTNGILRDPLLYILIIGGWVFWWISQEDDGDEKAARKRLKKIDEGKKAGG